MFSCSDFPGHAHSVIAIFGSMHMRLTLFLLLLAAALPAQRMEWLAHTDCGNLVNVRKMSADAQGNVYVGGEYEGELAVGSSLNDTVISKYGAAWRKSFLVRYNSNGVPTFVSQFKPTGGNSNLSYVQAVKALPSGECLVFVYCQGSLDFVDPHGVHIKPEQNVSDNLYCVNSDGSLKWSRTVNVGNVSFLETADDGTIYLVGSWGRHYSSAEDACILTFTSAGTPTDTVRFNGPGINAFKVWGNYLLLGITGGINKWKELPLFDVEVGHFGVFRMDRRTWRTEKLFVLQSPMREGLERSSVSSFRITFNTGSGNLWTDLVIPTDYGATVFMDKRYLRIEGNTHIVRLNEKGEQLLDRSFDCAQYNTQLIALDDGSSALMTTNWGTSFKYGNDSLKLPDHAMFINELIVMKLDRNLDREWWFTAGGTASNYHTSQLLYSGNGRFFLASDLLSTGTIMSVKQEVLWSSAMYVMKFNE